MQQPHSARRQREWEYTWNKCKLSVKWTYLRPAERAEFRWVDAGELMGTPPSLFPRIFSRHWSRRWKKTQRNWVEINVQIKTPVQQVSEVRDEPSRWARVPLRSAGDMSWFWRRGRGVTRGRGHRLSVTEGQSACERGLEPLETHVQELRKCVMIVTMLCCHKPQITE